MLENLITSKIRIKLLLKFFLNSNTRAYLRSLENEFGVSTNAIRLELNRFEQAGLITSQEEGNRKVFAANTSYPLFPEIKNLLHKHLGIDQLLIQVIEKMGEVDEVYLTGSFAHGLDSPNIEIILVGGNIDTAYLESLIAKAGQLIKKHICYSLMNNLQFESNCAGMSNKDLLLLWKHNK